MKRRKPTARLTPWLLVGMGLIGGLASVALLLVTLSHHDKRQAFDLNWDLSHSHRQQDIPEWADSSAADLSATELSPVNSLNIKLSDDRFVAETGQTVRRVGLYREGGQLMTVSILSYPMTADEARPLALRWCREWKLPTTEIDKWYAYGAKTFLSTAYNPKEKLDDNHPEPSVKLLPSFLDDRPFVVSLDFGWIRPEYIPDINRYRFEQSPP